MDFHCVEQVKGVISKMCDVTITLNSVEEITCPTKTVNGTTATTVGLTDDNEVILLVPTDMAKLSLGFAFDMGMTFIIEQHSNRILE